MLCASGLTVSPCNVSFFFLIRFFPFVIQRVGVFYCTCLRYTRQNLGRLCLCSKPPPVINMTSRCYGRVQSNSLGILPQPISVPCGNFTPEGPATCCVQGSTCLANNICYTANPPNGGSGYYMGGCTDPNYDTTNPACTSYCSESLHSVS